MNTLLDVPFTHPDTWLGAYYELAIEIGPRSDSRLAAAHRAIWEHPSVQGCYEDWHAEPSDQVRLVPAGEQLLEDGLGIACLPDGKRLPAGTFTVREDNDGPDWLGFFLPYGALYMAYPAAGAFTFGEAQATRVWRELLDRWLVEIARSVFAHVEFSLAIVGPEASGRDYASRIAVEGIPASRFDGYLWPEQGQLHWYPPTEW